MVWTGGGYLSVLPQPACRLRASLGNPRLQFSHYLLNGSHRSASSYQSIMVNTPGRLAHQTRARSTWVSSALPFPNRYYILRFIEPLLCVAFSRLRHLGLAPRHFALVDMALYMYPYAADNDIDVGPAFVQPFLTRCYVWDVFVGAYFIPACFVCA